MKHIIAILIIFTTFSMSAQTDGVGIGTTNPLSTLDLNGNLSLKHLVLPATAVTSDQDISDGVYISVNPQVTDQIFRLPDASLFPGRVYIIRNINNTFTAQLRTAGGLLFPKNSTTGSAEIYMYEGNLRTVIVISDGSNWTYMN